MKDRPSPYRIAAGRANIHNRSRIVYAGVMRGPLALFGLAIAAALPATGAARAVADPADRARMTAALLASLDAGTARRSAPARKMALKTLDRLGAHSLDTAVKPAAPVERPFRGRLLGPGYQRGWIDGGAELRLEQQFLAGHRASIAVVAAPAAPLALTVAESGAGTGAGSVCRAATDGCRWLPLYTQRYAITLRNAGATRVRYYLVLD